MGSFDTSENDKAFQNIFQKKEISTKDEIMKLLEYMNSEEIGELIRQVKK